MTPTRDSSEPPTTRGRSRSRTRNLASFVSRMFPSNKPEQGGTLRVRWEGSNNGAATDNNNNAETESAYRDLGMDPDRLTGFNEARDCSRSKAVPVPVPVPNTTVAASPRGGGSASRGGSGRSSSVPPRPRSSSDNHLRKNWPWNQKRSSSRPPSSSPRFVEDLADNNDNNRNKDAGEWPQQETAELGEASVKGKGKEKRKGIDKVPEPRNRIPLPKIQRKPIPPTTSASTSKQLPPAPTSSEQPQQQEQEHEPQQADPTPPLPPTPRRRTTSELLRIREQIRRERRSLKESGDWLSVQGADPWTGEPAVLTPTETVSTSSSEINDSLARRFMAALTGRRAAAERAHDLACRLEAEERERVQMARDRAKLAKIERRKEEEGVKIQREFSGGGGVEGDASGAVTPHKWRQFRDQWSSIAEPNLSPIAQSINSIANDLDESPKSIAPTKAVPNYSWPIQSPEPPHYGRAPGHLRSQSTDTIIHKTDEIPEHESPTGPATAENSRPGSIKDPGPSDQSHQEGKHFLWRRRRRMTDPGGQDGRSQARKIITSAQNAAQELDRRPQANHFRGLVIPDWHLHLLTPEPEENSGILSSTTDEATTPSPLPVPDQDKTAEQIETVNLLIGNRFTKGATATSYPSRLKELMKPLSIRQRLTSSPSSSCGLINSKETTRIPLLPHSRSLDMQPTYIDNQLSGGGRLSLFPKVIPKNGMVRHSIDIHQRVHANHPNPNPKTVDQSEKRQYSGESPSEGIALNVPERTSSQLGPSANSRRSACIPTTTTTGCEGGQRASLDGSNQNENNRAPTPPPWALHVFRTPDAKVVDTSSSNSGDPEATPTPTSSLSPPPTLTTSATTPTTTESEVPTTDEDVPALLETTKPTTSAAGPLPSSRPIPQRRSSLSFVPGAGTRGREIVTTSTRTLNKEKASPLDVVAERISPLAEDRTVHFSGDGLAKAKLKKEAYDKERQAGMERETVEAGEMTLKMVTPSSIKEAECPMGEITISVAKADGEEKGKQAMGVKTIPIMVQEPPLPPSRNGVNKQVNPNTGEGMNGTTKTFSGPQSTNKARVLAKPPRLSEHMHAVVREAAKTAGIKGCAKKTTEKLLNDGHQCLDRLPDSVKPATTMDPPSAQGGFYVPDKPINPRKGSCSPVKMTAKQQDVTQVNDAQKSKRATNGSTIKEAGKEKEKALQNVLQKKLEAEIQRQRLERRARPPSHLPRPQRQLQLHAHRLPEGRQEEQTKFDFPLPPRHLPVRRNGGSHIIEKKRVDPPLRLPPPIPIPIPIPEIIITQQPQTAGEPRSRAQQQQRVVHREVVVVTADTDAPSRLPIPPLSSTGSLIPRRSATATSVVVAAPVEETATSSSSSNNNTGTISSSSSRIPERNGGLRRKRAAWFGGAITAIPTAAATPTATATATTVAATADPVDKTKNEKTTGKASSTSSNKGNSTTTTAAAATTTTTTTTATTVVETLTRLALLLKAALLLLCAVGCAWWLVARPAFDPDSALWRRQRAGRGTRADLVVFVLAVLFAGAAGVVYWYANGLLGQVGVF